MDEAAAAEEDEVLEAAEEAPEEEASGVAAAPLPEVDVASVPQPAIIPATIPADTRTASKRFTFSFFILISFRVFNFTITAFYVPGFAEGRRQ